AGNCVPCMLCKSETLGGWKLCFSCQERWSGVLANARVSGSGIQRFVQQTLLSETRVLVSLRRRNAPPCCLGNRGAKMETECRVFACEQLYEFERSAPQGRPRGRRHGIVVLPLACAATS